MGRSGQERPTAFRREWGVVALASVFRSSCNWAETYSCSTYPVPTFRGRREKARLGVSGALEKVPPNIQTSGPLQRPCRVIEVMLYSGTLDFSGGDPAITLIPSKSSSVASRDYCDWQTHALLAVSSASAPCSPLPIPDSCFCGQMGNVVETVTSLAPISHRVHMVSVPPNDMFPANALRADD